ncbi:hypothetical protein SAMN04488137_3412 [Fictibacillus solisalsi]|uniref:NADH-quinone oxidoreductase subunit J n=1 Tax=Fictibacillus solisalsi TaxID=459525 RepID=A0A1G9YGK3_9BACL|nr:hypothetical protein [Fictibacillus solisalsi]SDN08072.1 hypothetical protein SAMN04488137_3412 [Fictibacillus solisalsi]
MNKYGWLSIFMVIISIIVFFVMRGPNASMSAGIIIFTTLSVAGIAFAILSKRWESITLGILLNIGVLVFAFFLLLAVGMGEA